MSIASAKPILLLCIGLFFLLFYGYICYADALEKIDPNWYILVYSKPIEQHQLSNMEIFVKPKETLYLNVQLHYKGKAKTPPVKLTISPAYKFIEASYSSVCSEGCLPGWQKIDITNSGKTPWPFDEGGCTLKEMLPNEVIVYRFAVKIPEDVSNYTDMRNIVSLLSRDNELIARNASSIIKVRNTGVPIVEFPSKLELAWYTAFPSTYSTYRHNKIRILWSTNRPGKYAVTINNRRVYHTGINTFKQSVIPISKTIGTINSKDFDQDVNNGKVKVDSIIEPMNLHPGENIIRLDFWDDDKNSDSIIFKMMYYNHKPKPVSNVRVELSNCEVTVRWTPPPEDPSIEAITVYILPVNTNFEISQNKVLGFVQYKESFVEINRYSSDSLGKPIRGNIEYRAYVVTLQTSGESSSPVESEPFIFNCQD